MILRTGFHVEAGNARGLALLYICYRLYVDVVKQNTEENKNIEVDKSNLLKAISTIIIADVTMSLDNVLGVAGAARDHYVLLVLVLFFQLF